MSDSSDSSLKVQTDKMFNSVKVKHQRRQQLNLNLKKKSKTLLSLRPSDEPSLGLLTDVHIAPMEIEYLFFAREILMQMFFLRQRN